MDLHCMLWTFYLYLQVRGETHCRKYSKTLAADARVCVSVCVCVRVCIYVCRGRRRCELLTMYQPKRREQVE